MRISICSLSVAVIGIVGLFGANSACIAQTAESPATASAAGASSSVNRATRTLSDGDLKIGLSFPTSGNAKNLAGNTWVEIGGDYLLKSKSATRSTGVTPLVYLDYAAGSRSDSGSDGSGGTLTFTISGNTLGAGVGLRTSVGATSTSPYVGAGIGLYFDTLSGKLTDAFGGSTASGSKSWTTTNLGFKLIAGINLGSRYLIEANYTDPGHVSVLGTNVDESSFGVEVGVKI